jgi:hypothetical protein
VVWWRNAVVSFACNSARLTTPVVMMLVVRARHTQKSKSGDWPGPRFSLTLSNQTCRRHRPFGHPATVGFVRGHEEKTGDVVEDVDDVQRYEFETNYKCPGVKMSQVFDRTLGIVKHTHYCRLG